MYSKTDLTNLTDRLWQNLDFFSKQPNRNRKHSLKKIKSNNLNRQNRHPIANAAGRVSQVAISLLLLQAMERGWHF